MLTSPAQFRRFLAPVVDFLAPRACLGCGTEGSWCCGPCLAAFEREPNVTCLGCERVSPNAATCERCRPEVRVAGVTAIARYRDPFVQRTIQTVKYAPARDAAGAFALLVDRFLADGGRTLLVNAVGASPLLVPVPLYRRRERERGFNQSTVIVSVLADRGVGQVVPALARVRPTDPQVALPSVARAENVLAAFACADRERVRGCAVLIVDDVVTTGATMSACAHVLRAAGASEVWGFAIARG